MSNDNFVHVKNWSMMFMEEFTQSLNIVKLFVLLKKFWLRELDEYMQMQ